MELHGKTGGVTVHDVRVVFGGPDNTTIRFVPIGDLNQSHRRENLTVQLEQTPQSIQVVAGRVEAPENARHAFTGLRLTEDGDYRQYDQEAAVLSSTERPTRTPVDAHAIGSAELRVTPQSAVFPFGIGDIVEAPSKLGPGLSGMITDTKSFHTST